jgi:hypothetical protein
MTTKLKGGYDTGRPATANEASLVGQEGLIIADGGSISCDYNKVAEAKQTA